MLAVPSLSDDDFASTLEWLRQRCARSLALPSSPLHSLNSFIHSWRMPLVKRTAHVRGTKCRRGPVSYIDASRLWYHFQKDVPSRICSRTINSSVRAATGRPRVISDPNQTAAFFAILNRDRRHLWNVAPHREQSVAPLCRTAPQCPIEIPAQTDADAATRTVTVDETNQRSGG